jgi:hypothetical protein
MDLDVSDGSPRTDGTRDNLDRGIAGVRLEMLKNTVSVRVELPRLTGM